MLFVGSVYKAEKLLLGKPLENTANLIGISYTHYSFQVKPPQLAKYSKTYFGYLLTNK